MFKTEEAVKSCPAVDPVTGLVVVGSHDGHVYVLDPLVSVHLWVFFSPSHILQQGQSKVKYNKIMFLNVSDWSEKITKNCSC